MLKRLRDVMAGPGSAQHRLEQVVKVIAADMVAEVCSVYIKRAGDMLELFATEGLKPEAVHQTRLRVGEGLVGDIGAHARALALADAQAHPQFAYRPETGEEAYASLMGVPILRSGRVLGVLVVQNKTRRQYAEEEIEHLETIAMVLAELVATGELIKPAEMLATEGNAMLPSRLEGVRINGGLGIGHAVLHQRRVIIRKVVAEDADEEILRFRAALAGMQSAIDQMIDAVDREGEHRDILETYRMFAEDRGWIGRIAEAIKTGLTAEAAVQKVQNDTRARMAQVTDAYLRERLLDLDDLAARLLQHLSGDVDLLVEMPPSDAILIARSMGPAELLDYDRTTLRALVLEEGSATSHVAIVARALDIPVVGRVSGILAKVESGDQIIVDGDNGLVMVRPGDDVMEHFATAIVARQQRQESFAAMRHLPATTVDGTDVSLLLNAGMLADLSHVDETGAAGVGLYRTEIPFMIRSAYPDLASQIDIYQRVLDRVGGRPVVFRTLDVGGDKRLPYFSYDDDENPAMGWRAIRISVDRPAMLRQQLRGMIRAAAGRPLSIMFPMVSEVAELDIALAVLRLEVAREEARGGAVPAPLSVGVMIEVPSLCWQIDQVLQRVDFLSVGSNDLMQFLFASDRGSPTMADRFDTLAPAMLKLLHMLAHKANQAGKPITVCGEMAGRPLEAMTLLALGYRRLSMNPAAIGPVKTMVRSLDIAAISPYVCGLLEATDHSLRQKLRSLARDHGVLT
ncbi:MAG: phosphoenolpyruvate--protein phosphotransferase [Alphaproteobacteria bacterium]|nr:phosphoenolpyruvate--protein phosphotransferase [Alphaproteobacteria bacterium]MBU0796170.1 phosphoenolpyruvate--protein phosphotransferase [Alphaproteobacteria bacterium]MBU0888045.1 phosphoenolpyruvate--protein phosphotransferase [Alphaproteobacteria bacterium]MBU1812996.1 phosphoenolpyruvate--protein phosphotransferase [Alphaproteobacteria bacterium]MBU2089367.1 phosphoenolpyruvate--protein phosphotransferase [Alphaproteobacteria bacterium]